MDITCTVPVTNYDRILLAHGGGGRMTHQLISQIFYPAFRNSLLEQDHDGSVFAVKEGRMACSTDSFVVDPIFFPGGNIGDLAVNGTVNDLACCGAVPLYITAGFILEEGLLLSDLRIIVESMKQAALKAGIQIIAGDTKVVERGKCDKIFINTTGIGLVPEGFHISPHNACAGDVVLCSGLIGMHGITILSAREQLEFESNLKSDTASLNKMITEVLDKVGNVHVLRDPTRGGVSGTLNEIATSAQVEIILKESWLPVPEAVYAACEMLGLDPLYVANEGIVLVVAPEKFASDILSVMKKFPEGKYAALIGKVHASEKALVKMETQLGGTRIVDMLSGEQLPRIC